MTIWARVRAIGALTCTAAVTLVSCDRGPSEPVGPGQVEARLVSPNGPEGAAVLALVGTGLGQVQAVFGEAFTDNAQGALRIVVIRDEPGEIVLRLTLDDVATLPSATVLEVASGDNELRTDLTAYRVQFDPVVVEPAPTGVPQ